MINGKKIYELIWFYDELDILDARFHELYDYIDKWIIVEYPFDYARIQRPYYYADNKKRFEQFENKIIHVIDDHQYNGMQSLQLLWNRKQSPLIRNALSDLKQDDYLITNDGDAFLTHYCFEKFNPSVVYSFCIHWYLWYFNCCTPDAIFNWGQAAPYKYYDINMMVNQDRFKTDNVPLLYVGEDQLNHNQAGYHFAKCGGAEIASRHMKGHPHQDLVIDSAVTNIELIKERMEKGYGWTDVSMGKAGKDWKWETIPYDPKRYTKYINDNPQIYNKYFKGGMNI
jgi:beta-1,4-mannosyl-glycoprotein beta-1,4-N-acetylglucosaminyltransferase